ncbi:MAG: hypothetical protein ACPGO5_04465 [Patescibacteria group bacterium]
MSIQTVVYIALFILSGVIGYLFDRKKKQHPLFGWDRFPSILLGTFSISFLMGAIWGGLITIWLLASVILFVSIILSAIVEGEHGIMEVKELNIESVWLAYLFADFLTFVIGGALSILKIAP